MGNFNRVFRQTFAYKPNATEGTASLTSRTHFNFHSIPKPKIVTASAPSHFARDFSDIPIHSGRRNQTLQRSAVGHVDSAQTAVPPIVDEVLGSAGRPLPTATRVFMEPRFGVDFGDVRIHNDARAAESARAVSASAYTVGRDIVFAEGRFRPETQAGRHLLSHELAHVVQQGGSFSQSARGIGAADDHSERQAEAAASSVEAGRSAAPLLDRGHAHASHTLHRQPQPPPLQPLKYDSNIKHVPPLDPGQTADHLIDLLYEKKKNGEITAFTIKGFASGEEVFLWGILYSLSERARWGTEADVIIPIGWPKGGAPVPQGQVTVRIDSRGAASAELVRRGVPTATVRMTAADLATAYNLASVTDDGTAHWSPAELNDVASALAMMPGPDKAALVQVELIRVSAIPGHPNDAGQFETPHPAATKAEDVQTHAKLRLGNRAFDHDTVQFAGGAAKTVPASFFAILHEVGHAVESAVYREKWRAHAEALAAVRAARDAVQETDARKKERSQIEDKLKTAKGAEKDRLQKKIAQFDEELVTQAEAAGDKEAARTKITDKVKEITDMDAAGQTQRLTNFMDVVHRNRIAPITNYAATGDAEFYAEAYSLWLVDREFLWNNYRELFKFFESGDYRN